MQKCKLCRKLITHNYHVGSCQINGTVAFGGCEHFEEIKEFIVVSYPIHDFKHSTYVQFLKTKEEIKEIEASIIEEEGKDRLTEECCDLIQATFNIIEIIEPGGVQGALELHAKKMIERGYPVKYFIQMEV